MEILRSGGWGRAFTKWIISGHLKEAFKLAKLTVWVREGDTIQLKVDYKQYMTVVKKKKSEFKIKKPSSIKITVFFKIPWFYHNDMKKWSIQNK